LPAPVTTATLPAKSMSMVFLPHPLAIASSPRVGTKCRPEDKLRDEAISIRL
jgi:hypothetical protein